MGLVVTFAIELQHGHLLHVLVLRDALRLDLGQRLRDLLGGLRAQGVWELDGEADDEPALVEGVFVGGEALVQDHLHRAVLQHLARLSAHQDGAAVQRLKSKHLCTMSTSVCGQKV